MDKPVILLATAALLLTFALHSPPLAFGVPVEVKNETLAKADRVVVTIGGLGGINVTRAKISQDAQGCQNPNVTGQVGRVDATSVALTWAKPCVAPEDRVTIDLTTDAVPANPNAVFGAPTWVRDGTLQLQFRNDHSGLSAFADAANRTLVRDNELAEHVKDAIDSNFRSAIFTFHQCYGGGFLDDLLSVLPADKPWSGSSATSATRCSELGVPKDPTDPKAPKEQFPLPKSKKTESKKGFAGYAREHTEALDKGNTARQAFKTALAQDPFGPGGTDHETPQYVSSGQPGDEVKVAGDANSHAILFTGRPDFCAHWNETVRVYQMLIRKNYLAGNIKVMFGDGSATLRSLNPVPAERDPDRNALTECTPPDGVKLREADLTPATRTGLLDAIDALKPKFGPDTNGGQLFFWASNHGALLDPADQAGAACPPAGGCAITVTLAQAFFDRLALSLIPATVLLDQDGAVTSTSEVFLNSVAPGNSLGFIDPTTSSQEFAFDRDQAVEGVNTVLIVADNAGQPFSISSAAVSAGIPSEPPLFITSVTGSASRVGAQAGPGADARAQVRIAIKFEFAGFVDLSASTVTIHRLIAELGGAGELVDGDDGDLLPLTLLVPRAGSTPDAAIYETAAGATPLVRAEIKTRGNDLFELAMKVDKATIPGFPALCAGRSPRTALTTSLTIDRQEGPGEPAVRLPPVSATQRAGAAWISSEARYHRRPVPSGLREPRTPHGASTVTGGDQSDWITRERSRSGGPGGALTTARTRSPRAGGDATAGGAPPRPRAPPTVAAAPRGAADWLRRAPPWEP